MANITKPDRSGEPVLIPKMHAERDIERQRLLTIPEEVGDVQSGFSPPDRGKDAWLVLVAAFILEALVWGEFLEATILHYPHLVSCSWIQETYKGLTRNIWLSCHEARISTS